MTVMRNAALLAIASLALAGCGDDSSGGGSGGSGGNGSIDACSIVTQQDATTLFGVEATLSTEPVPQQGLLGHCLWEWENADADSHLLQFYIWDGEGYYSEPADSQPFAIGEKGYVRVHDVAGVDIQWLQNGLAPMLSYFTYGSSVPKASSKAEEVKALAKKASAALP